MQVKLVYSLALGLVVVRTLLLVVGGTLLLVAGLALLLILGAVSGLVHSSAFWRVSSQGGEGDTGDHKLRRGKNDHLCVNKSLIARIILTS